MSITVVIPVYNGAKTIGRLVDALVEALGSSGLQIVLVNDASPDNSRKVCLELARQRPAIVTFVHLARNFGEHNAVMAGLHYARGDYIVIMDDDFQTPPEEVTKLVEEARRGDYDVVYSRYEKKKHSLFRNVGSLLHNWMAARLIGKPKGLYLSSFKCINRFLVDEVTKYTGPYPYLDGLILRSTANIGTVLVRHDKREEGASGYTFHKLIRLWLNMFLNFSIKPLRISSLLGALMTLLGALFGAFVVIDKLLNPDQPVGWPTLIIVIVLFSGMQLVLLGLLGEYLGSMFLSHNQTPQFVVRDVQNDREEEDEI